jgi:hypothetical protein
MCLPSPCCPSPGNFARSLGATENEIQGIDDFCKELLVTLGCRDRQTAGKSTLLGIVHKNVLEAAKKSFPNAAPDCLAPAIQGIINGIGLAFEACPRGEAAFIQALLTNIAPHIGKLLQCIFNEQRAKELELKFHRQFYVQAVDWLACILPLLMTLCKMGCQLPGGDAACPPNSPPLDPSPFGPDAPPHNPVVKRTSQQLESTEGTY